MRNKSDAEACADILRVLTTEGRWLCVRDTRRAAGLTHKRVKKLAPLMTDTVAIQKNGQNTYLATKAVAATQKIIVSTVGHVEGRKKGLAKRKDRLWAEIEALDEWVGQQDLERACQMAHDTARKLLGELIDEGKVTKLTTLNHRGRTVAVYLSSAKAAGTPYESKPSQNNGVGRPKWIYTDLLSPDDAGRARPWRPSRSESGSARFVRLAMERTLAGEELTESELTEAAHNAGIMIGTGTATEAVKAFKRRAEAELARRKRERLGYAPMEARA